MDQTTNLQARDTVENVLQIPQERMRELTWIIDDICAKKKTKAEAIVAIAEAKATDVEKTYMGFLLCKRYVASLPFPLSAMVLQRIG